MFKTVASEAPAVRNDACVEAMKTKMKTSRAMVDGGEPRARLSGRQDERRIA